MIDYHIKSNMKRIRIVLVILIFLLTYLLGLVNYSEATFINPQLRKVKFILSTDQLVSDQFYLNNKVDKSRLMVAKNVDENYSNLFYFNQITNQMSKDLYKGLLHNVNATGQINISTNYTLQVEATDDETLQAVYNEQVKPYIYDAFCAFILDNPQYYWIQDSGIDGEVIAEIDEQNKIMKLEKAILFISEIQESSQKEQFNAKLSEVVSSITGDNIYDMAKAAHDYICTNVQGQTSSDESISRTAYGALMNNKANSEGQSNLFVLLCREKGINAVAIKGKVSNQNAQWAAVYQEDMQKWYAVDISLDNGTEDTSDYFMVGNNTEINGQKFSNTHVANVIAYGNQATVFKAPALTNVAYGEFDVTVEYSNTEPTKDNVIVTITANRNITEPEGWTLSADKKSIQKTYTENTTETVTITSENSETIEQEIVINNIDKQAPNVTVTYNPPAETPAQSVTVTLTADEEVQPIEGWELSEDRKVLTKVYNQNTTENVIVNDIASNSTEVSISINNINEGTFQCTVQYSETNPTNKDVTAFITADRELVVPEGWSIITDPKTVAKTYTENTQETVTVSDTEGNSTTVNINIQNIDKVAPILEVSYSTTELTNQSVVATIKSNEQLQQPEGWEITSDKLTISKTYTLNANETVKVSDLAGNVIEQNIVINNIDKEPPTLDINYQTSGNQVTVTITSNEQLQPVEGWNLSADALILTKTYTEEMVDVIDVKDLAGNITEATIDIPDLSGNNVDINQVSPDGKNPNSDQTISPNKLPQAGVISIITFVAILVVLSIVFYIKFRKYDYTRDMKKK